MSVQINCDRCRVDTKGRFLRGEISVTRGVYASTSSTISPARLFGKLDWHLCENCYADLKRWSDAPPVAG